MCSSTYLEHRGREERYKVENSKRQILEDIVVHAKKLGLYQVLGKGGPLKDSE